MSGRVLRLPIKGRPESKEKALETRIQAGNERIIMIASWLGLVSFLYSVYAIPVDVDVDEKKSTSHIINSLDILVYVCLLILTVITGWVFKQRRISFIHESGLAVIYGLVIGLFLRFMGLQSIGGDPEGITIYVKPFGLDNETRSLLALGKRPPHAVILKVNQTGYPLDTNEKVNDHQLVKYVRTDDLQGMDHLVFANEPGQEIIERATFNPEIFFYVLLPPIIFHAGYSMRKKHFFDNFGAIMAFALLGTTISTFVIGVMMYFVGKLITLELHFLDSLHFGAIISATDPVTILAVFQDIHVDSTLNGLVLGESLLNDAVAIVLTSSIEQYALLATEGEQFEVNALFMTFVRFFSIVFGSIGLGAVIGASTALVTKFTTIREHPLLETALFILMSYSSYLFAEVCEMSGIVSVLFCGICQAHYTYKNLSDESQNRTKEFFECINFIAENFIFCYIGVSMFTYSRHYFDITFILGAFFAIGVARACNIYPLSMIVNIGRKYKIPKNFQHLLWFSGLRGAMAFALAVQNTVTPERRMFFTTTCLISIITVIVLGGLTTPMITFFKVPLENSLAEAESLLGHPQASSSSEEIKDSRQAKCVKMLKRIDKVFLKPFLTISKPSLVETMPAMCLPLSRFFTTNQQLDDELLDETRGQESLPDESEIIPQ